MDNLCGAVGMAGDPRVLQGARRLAGIKVSSVTFSALEGFVGADQPLNQRQERLPIS